MTVDGSPKPGDIRCREHGWFTPYLLGATPGGTYVYTKCPGCFGDIDSQKAAGKKGEEAAKKNAFIGNLFGSAGIPPRFKDRDFRNYRADTEGQKKALLVAEKYATSFDERLRHGGGLVLCGKPGTGKTHLSAAIANHVIRQFGRSVLFTTVMRSVRRVKDTYSRTSQKTEAEVVAEFVLPDLLILDEIGVQFGSETEKLIMFDILNGRYEQVKPTILLSNLTESELADYIGTRTLDRMKEGGGLVLAFDWDSYRGNVHKDEDLPVRDIKPQTWEEF